MLIHRRTMGVLDLCWSGQWTKDQTGRLLPMLRECSLCPGLDPEEWWEVPRNSPLGRKARRCYPWCAPVLRDGVLVDIIPLGRQPAAPRPPPVKHKQRRGRPGVLEHLLKGT